MEEPIIETKTDISYSFEKEINLVSDTNNSYNIIFKVNDHLSYLEIYATKIIDLFPKTFFNKFSCEQIKQNKYFAMCDNLKEICIELDERIKQKEVRLVEKENMVVISISLPSIKIKEITFELILTKKNINDKVNDLMQIISELKKELNAYKLENINLKNNITKQIEEIKLNQNDEINKLKHRISLLEDKVNESIIEKNKEQESSILTDKAELSFVYSLFSTKPKFELLYRATRDGCYPKDFHSKCDNKGPTLTLIQTDDNKKFGGYISKDRQSGSRDQVYVKDKNAFIFSINKKKKYKIKDEKVDAFDYSSIRGPNFTTSLGFYSNVDSGNMFKPANAYESETIPDYKSFNKYEFAGKNNFQAIEIEVFSVK